jgi:hypothetical protein
MPHSPVVTIQYANAGWSTSIANAINSQNYVRVVIKGSLASTLKSKLGFPQVCSVPAPPFSAVPIPYPNISNCLSGLPTLLTQVALAYTTKGYTSFKASYNAHGSGTSDNEFVLDLR